MLTPRRSVLLKTAMAVCAVLVSAGVLSAKDAAPAGDGAQAGRMVVVTLQDGSRIVGRLKAMAENRVTIDTSSMGRIQVSLAKIQTIRPVGNATSHSKQPGAPPQKAVSSAAAPDMLNNLLQNMGQNPKIMKQILRLSEDPEIRQLVQDPDIQKAVRSGDLLQLLHNPKILRMMTDPRIQQISKHVLEQSGVEAGPEAAPAAPQKGEHAR